MHDGVAGFVVSAMPGIKCHSQSPTFSSGKEKGTSDIGASRLYTIMEKLLDDLSFEAPDMHVGRVIVNAAYVKQRLEKLAADEDLSKFIL